MLLQGGQEQWQGPVQLAPPVEPVVSAGAVGIDLDGDVELMQSLHEGGVLGVEGLLDLLCLPAGRRTVERAWLAVGLPPTGRTSWLCGQG